MADSTNAPEVVVAAETVPVPEPSSGPRSITTAVWAPGKTMSMETLRSQAVINTRDAVPVLAYDTPDVEVTGTKAKKIDGVDGTVWELSVTYTPRSGAPSEPVDLEMVIQEARAAALGTHPGDPDFLGDPA